MFVILIYSECDSGDHFTEKKTTRKKNRVENFETVAMKKPELGMKKEKKSINPEVEEMNETEQKVRRLNLRLAQWMNDRKK